MVWRRNFGPKRLPKSPTRRNISPFLCAKSFTYSNCFTAQRWLFKDIAAQKFAAPDGISCSRKHAKSRCSSPPAAIPAARWRTVSQIFPTSLSTCCFPKAGLAALQEQQLTRVADNIVPVEVDGFLTIVRRWSNRHLPIRTCHISI